MDKGLKLKTGRGRPRWVYLSGLAVTLCVSFCLGPEFSEFLFWECGSRGSAEGSIVNLASGLADKKAGNPLWYSAAGFLPTLLAAQVNRNLSLKRHISHGSTAIMNF